MIKNKNYWLFTHLLLTIFFLSIQTSAQGQSKPTTNFLVVKPGDESATSALASDYLMTITGYLRSQVPFLHSKALRGWIANRLDSAAVVLQQRRPLFAFVPTGFYLEHLYNANWKATPIAQAPRFGKTTEKYYLVSSKAGPMAISALKGKIVRTAFSIDWKYLKNVVFPKAFQPGIDFQLEPSDNLADDMFLLIEGANQESTSIQELPASALLLDEELKNFFEEDDLVWNEIQIIWSSQELPGYLFVIIGNEWQEDDKTNLFKALHDMQNNQTGTELLDLMQSSGFSKVDTILLEQIIQKYFALEMSK